MKESELNYVDTTGGMNGYPSNIRPMIISDSISELIKIKEHFEDQGLSVECYQLHRRNGWGLWERCSINFMNKGHFMSVNDQDWYLDLNMSHSKKMVLKEIKEFLFGDEKHSEAEVQQKLNETCDDFYNDISHHKGEIRVFVDMGNHLVDYVVSDDSANYSYDTHQYQLAIEADDM